MPKSVFLVIHAPCKLRKRHLFRLHLKNSKKKILVVVEVYQKNYLILFNMKEDG